MHSPPPEDPRENHRDAGWESREEPYRLLFEKNPLPMWLIDRSTLVFLEVNEAAVRRYGYSREEFLRLTLRDIHPPEEVLKLTQSLAQALRLEGGGEAGQAGVWRHRRKDGTYIGVDVTWSMIPFRGRRALLMLAHDITQQRRTDAALRASEERFRLLVQSCQDYAIFMLDPHGHVASWNTGAERIKGYHEAEILGQHFRRFYTAEDVARRLPEHVLELAAREGHRESEGWRVRKDGSRFWANVVITALYDEPGQLRGFAKVTRDITERRQAEETLRQAHEALEQRVQDRTAALAASNDALRAEINERKRAEERLKASLSEKAVLLREIHHRVKNNLQVISSLLSLQSSFITDPKALAIFTDCQHRIYSMALIHQSLYQSQNLASIDLAAFLTTLTEDLYRSYAVDAARIILSTIAEELVLSLDTAVPCALLLNELVSNCLKHAFPNGQVGHIWITLRREESGRIVLRVQDDGVGFPEGVDLQRPDSFGLQLVRILAEQLQATLEFERHRGAAVTMTFVEHVHSAAG